MNDIKPRNEKGQAHGRWETYHSNGQLANKGIYINGQQNGYWEVYRADGRLHYIINHILGKKVGYCKFVWFDNVEEKEYHAK